MCHRKQCDMDWSKMLYFLLDFIDKRWIQNNETKKWGAYWTFIKCSLAFHPCWMAFDVSVFIDCSSVKWAFFPTSWRIVCVYLVMIFFLLRKVQSYMIKCLYKTFQKLCTNICFPALWLFVAVLNVCLFAHYYTY